MQAEEIAGIAAALGRPVAGVATLAGGFSHETCLLTLGDGQVVARIGGSDPAIEAAIMAAAGRLVPVPRVLHVLPSAQGADGARPAMVLEYVEGTPLSQVLSVGRADGMGALPGLGRALRGSCTGADRHRPPCQAGPCRRQPEELPGHARQRRLAGGRSP